MITLDTFKKIFVLTGILFIPFTITHAKIMTGAYADMDVTLSADTVDVDMEGLDVDVQGDTVDVTTDNLDVDVDGDDVTVTTNDLDVDVNGNAVDVRTTNTPTQQDVTSVRTGSNGEVDVKTDQVRVQTNTNTGQTNITTTANGNAVKTSIQNGGLSTRIENGSVSVETEDMLVDIDDGSRVLFQNESDVKTYATIVERKNKNIESITTTDDAVEMNVLSEGRLFGIFPMKYVARMQVKDSGTVTVTEPWYTFLMTKKAMAQVKSAVETRLATMTLAKDAEEKPFVRAQMINVVSDSVSVSVGDDGVSVDTGDVSVDISGGSVNVDLR